MHNDSLTELQNAYCETKYTIEENGIVIRPGRMCPYFMEFCLENSIKEWAFITASNPGSVKMKEDLNQMANQKLFSDLDRAGYLVLDGLGIPKNGQLWKPEVSFFVANIRLDEAVILAKRFHQNAFIYGSDSVLPSVIWVGGGHV